MQCFLKWNCLLYRRPAVLFQTHTIIQYLYRKPLLTEIMSSSETPQFLMSGFLLLIWDRSILASKMSHSAALKSKIYPVHPSIRTSKYLRKSVIKSEPFLSVFLLLTPKISQQNSHLQNAFQPFSKPAFISDWGAQATLATSGKRWSPGAWIWMLSGVKEWGSVMQCCLWHILCSAPCSNHTPDVPGLLLLSLNLRPTSVCQQQEPRSMKPSADRITHKRAVLSLAFQELQGSPFKRN